MFSPILRDFKVVLSSPVIKKVPEDLSNLSKNEHTIAIFSNWWRSSTFLLKYMIEKHKVYITQDTEGRLQKTVNLVILAKLASTPHPLPAR